jgi:hypothetical protein
MHHRAPIAFIPIIQGVLPVLLLALWAMDARPQSNTTILGYGGGPVKSRAEREAEFESYAHKKLEGRTPSVEDENWYEMSEVDLGIVLQHLSPYDRYLYCVAEPELFSQNCSNPEDDEDGGGACTSVDTKPKIHGYFPTDNMFLLSARQLEFLAMDRAGTLAFIKEDVRRFGILTTHQKEVLLHLDAVELIPWMVDYFKHTTKQQDSDVLVLFFQLMRDHRYPPFMESRTYSAVYGNGRAYTGYIYLNQPNIDLTIERAMGLYLSSGR